MTRYLYMLSILLLCCAEAAIAQNKSYDLSYFLGQFLDMKSLPQYVSDSYSASFSTYDRRGGNDDGFGGTYSFIRRNADSSLVIAELHGPGVITRIWTPTPTNDSLEFYIDDSTRPAFSIRYRDLYTGKVYPFVSPLCANQLGGFYCYLPIPFSKYFKIVAKTKKLRFHQINYRLFPGATGVKSFSINLKEEEKDLLEQINKSWAHPGKRSFADPGTKKMQSSITLKPGDTRTVFMSATGGRIEGFMLHSNSALDSIARQIDLRITWDDERSPAVLVPLADFFGYAFGTASMQSLLAGSDGKTFYCFFPMPFDKKAHIEMIYRNGALASRWGNISLDRKSVV